MVKEQKKRLKDMEIIELALRHHSRHIDDTSNAALKMMRRKFGYKASKEALTQAENIIKIMGYDLDSYRKGSFTGPFR